LSLADTTFVFSLCFPFIGCQTLNVAMTDIHLSLAESACASVDGAGAVSYPDAMVVTTGSYSTSGFATSSGSLNNIGQGAISGRIIRPTSSSVLLDQLTLASQTIVVDPASLPTGITALTVVIEPNLTNTTMS